VAVSFPGWFTRTRPGGAGEEPDGSRRYREAMTSGLGGAGLCNKGGTAEGFFRPLRRKKPFDVLPQFLGARTALL